MTEALTPAADASLIEARLNAIADAVAAGQVSVADLAGRAGVPYETARETLKRRGAGPKSVANLIALERAFLKLTASSAPPARVEAALLRPCRGFGGQAE